MNQLLSRVVPGATKMIRMDHSHTMLTFHRYQPDLPPARKRAIVETVCLALEIHATLEEEIFYPALHEVAPSDPALQKAQPEHDEMKRLIGVLRSMEPTDADYDTRFYELMRDVVHHVADEETQMLPAAELLLKERLGELGARMTKRRLELAAPHAGEIAVNSARAMPAATMLLAGGLLAGGWLLGRAFDSRRA
jgi:hypothetical protein